MAFCKFVSYIFCKLSKVNLVLNSSKTKMRIVLYFEIRKVNAGFQIEFLFSTFSFSTFNHSSVSPGKITKAIVSHQTQSIFFLRISLKIMRSHDLILRVEVSEQIHPFIYSKISIQNICKKWTILEKIGKCRVYISHKMSIDKMRYC